MQELQRHIMSHLFNQNREEMYCIYSTEINGREEEDKRTGLLQSLLE